VAAWADATGVMESGLDRKGAGRVERKERTGIRQSVAVRAPNRIIAKGPAGSYFPWHFYAPGPNFFLSRLFNNKGKIVRALNFQMIHGRGGEPQTDGYIYLLYIWYIKNGGGQLSWQKEVAKAKFEKWTSKWKRQIKLFLMKMQDATGRN